MCVMVCGVCKSVGVLCETKKTNTHAPGPCHVHVTVSCGEEEGEETAQDKHRIRRSVSENFSVCPCLLGKAEDTLFLIGVI